MVEPDIWKVDITTRRFPIPLVHGSYGFLQLGVVFLVDTTCVYPEILQIIRRSLLGTKLDLFVPVCVVLVGRLEPEVFEADFIVIVTPSMR